MWQEVGYHPCCLASQGIGTVWLGWQGGVAASSHRPPPAGQILFTGFTVTVCPPSLAHHAKIGQELGDQCQGNPLEVGRGERRNSRGRERNRSRWNNGHRESVTGWKKGLSQKFGCFVSQLTCRIYREAGRGRRYLFFLSVIVFVCYETDSPFLQQHKVRFVDTLMEMHWCSFVLVFLNVIKQKRGDICSLAAVKSQITILELQMTASNCSLTHNICPDPLATACLCSTQFFSLTFCILTHVFTVGGNGKWLIHHTEFPSLSSSYSGLAHNDTFLCGGADRHCLVWMCVFVCFVLY